MSPLQIIGIVVQAIALLPKVLSAFKDVAKMSRRYSDGGFWNDVRVTRDIVWHVLNLANEGEKALAKLNLLETKHRALIGDREGLSNQRTSLKRRRETFTGHQTAEKV